MSPMTRLVAVAIDKDKGSQIAIKWAVDNLLSRGHTVILVHVAQSVTTLSQSPSMVSSRPNQAADSIDEFPKDRKLRELFLPFRVYCTRKDIQYYDVVLDDSDVTRALVEFVNRSAIDMLVLGATVNGSIFRFNAKDIPGSVLKGAPDFCSVYVIHNGKISSTRAASRPPPFIMSPLRNRILSDQANTNSNGVEEYVSSSNNFSNLSTYSNLRNQRGFNLMMIAIWICTWAFLLAPQN